MTQAEPAIQISSVKKVINGTILAVWILIGALTMIIGKLLRSNTIQFGFPLIFHGFVCRLFGMQPVVKGEPISELPTLFVSNHVSYLDIFVLGKLLRGSFIAKAEVAGWPVFGKLAGLQNTMFLERRAAKAREQVGLVQRHLAEKGNLIMFPEGTSTSGDYVAKFRSSLFAATEGVVIQPVSIAYTRYNGEVMSQDQREYYAWYLPDPVNAPGVNNTPFLAHFLQGLGLGPSTVEVIFHKPTKITPSYSRKDCALACEAAVRHGLHTAIGLPSEDAELAAGS